MSSKVRIKIAAFSHEPIYKSYNIILEAASRLGIDTTGPISLPTKIKRYCVLRSPHVDKKSREHLEIRIYKKFIDLYNLSNDKLQNLLDEAYPPGVQITVF